VKKSKSGSTFLMVALLLVSVLAAIGLSREQETNLQFIMQRKLDNAHAILEALITEDYESLEDSAGAIVKLSEESGWFVIETPDYTERSTSFRRAASEIQAAAKEKNLDRAALAYVDMTLKCVQCHRYMRGTAKAGLGPGSFVPFPAGLGQKPQP
jgi:hypothetical protein